MANEGHWGSLRSGLSAWTLKCGVWELSHMATLSLLPLLIATFPVSGINKYPYILKISIRIKISCERKMKETLSRPSAPQWIKPSEAVSWSKTYCYTTTVECNCITKSHFYSGWQTQYYMRFPFYFLNTIYAQSAFSAANMHLIRTKQTFNLLFTKLTWTWPSGHIS